MNVHESWTTIGPEEVAEEEVRAAFRASVVDRARRRLGAVRPAGPNVWVVAGNPALGDQHPGYVIRLEGHRYACSCYGHRHGEHRERRVCSHVVAVILHRKAERVGRRAPAAPGIPGRDDPMWDDPYVGGLPGWVRELRPVQWQAVQQIVEAFERGKRFVLLSAPTGSGKTLIAELVRRRLRVRALYLCHTRTLQQQFLRDFPYAAVLMGRENYPTRDFPERFGDPVEPLTAAECTKARRELPACDRCPVPGEGDWDAEQGAPAGLHCDWCHPVEACPYEQAKLRALRARLACTNYAYFLAEANGPGRFSGWPLIVLDEADVLEELLMGYVEVRVSPTRLARLKIGVPEKKTVPAAWEEWVERQAIPAVRRELARVKERVEERPEPRDVREMRFLERLLSGLERVRGQLGSGWVYTGYAGAEPGSHPVVFRPIWVDKFAPDLVWRHGERFLLMSATLVSPHQVALDLGIPEDRMAFVELPSTFPVQRRPIYVLPKVSMTNKTRDGEWPKAVESLDRIVARYPGERVLVHTHSYELARYVCERSAYRERIVSYATAGERDRALERFLRTPGAVLVAPSMERGIDLPDDACRVVVVLKTPFPYLGDRQVSARLHSRGGQQWYDVQAIRALVQATGRGVRHAEDWADTYILDAQFMELWRRRKHLFPRWWRDALVWSDRPQGG